MSIFLSVFPVSLDCSDCVQRTHVRFSPFPPNRPCAYTVLIRSLISASVVGTKTLSNSLALVLLFHFKHKFRDLHAPNIIYYFILKMIIWYIDPTSWYLWPCIVCIYFPPRYIHLLTVLLQIYIL